nr:hypothetical protein [Caldalkalibacillus thermarum]
MIILLLEQVYLALCSHMKQLREEVSGRNDLGFNEMVELDLKYIQERSIWYKINDQGI